MSNNKIKIKKIKQDVIWHHVFYTLDDLHNNYCYDDEKFIEMLKELYLYVEEKVSPPECSGDIVDRYVIMEYEDI